MGLFTLETGFIPICLRSLEEFSVFQVWDVTMNMLGTEESPSFKAKGAEVHGLLVFIVEILETHQPQLSTCSQEIRYKAAALLQAGKAAIRFDKLLSKSTMRMSEEETGNLMAEYLHFAILYERAGGDLVHKFHLMCHAIHFTRKHGNLRLHSTYRSESFNGVLARIAAK